MARCSFILTAGVIAAFSFSAQAQWLDYKTPGIPRTKDGKADLSAPTPRLANGKPDFSGLWRDDEKAGAAVGKAMDALRPKPWAEAIAKKRKQEIFRDSPSVLCLPPGPQADIGVERIIQTPAMLVLLYDGTLYRQIFLDGRSLERDPNPDWMGYSVGHWMATRSSSKATASTIAPGSTDRVIRTRNNYALPKFSAVPISAISN